MPIQDRSKYLSSDSIGLAHLKISGYIAAVDWEQQKLGILNQPATKAHCFAAWPASKSARLSALQRVEERISHCQGKQLKLQDQWLIFLWLPLWYRYMGWPVHMVSIPNHSQRHQWSNLDLSPIGHCMVNQKAGVPFAHACLLVIPSAP